MFHKSKNDKLIYGIIGLGRFGETLAHELAANGAELIVLDQNEEKIQAIREYTENAFVVKNLEKSISFKDNISTTLGTLNLNDCSAASLAILLNLISLDSFFLGSSFSRISG